MFSTAITESLFKVAFQPAKIICRGSLTTGADVHAAGSIKLYGLRGTPYRSAPEIAHVVLGLWSTLTLVFCISSLTNQVSGKVLGIVIAHIAAIVTAGGCA